MHIKIKCGKMNNYELIWNVNIIRDEHTIWFYIGLMTKKILYTPPHPDRYNRSDLNLTAQGR